ncbi:MAG: beta-glucosidase [Propionibacteriaceae bacterium]|jgi:beta-glucosidase|nr:beta-glucosidase [Propionibacteriaceae bacterium]
MSVHFGDDFVFGAATAAYQIEGAVTAGGRGPSIWDTFSHTPGKVEGGDTGDVACDHFHRLEADLDLLAELGVDSYRFSIAWPRIQPAGTGSPNQAGLDFYSRLVDGLLARGIAPFATLYHWDLPQALEDRGGWRARDTAYRFADYADIMATALGDRVARWATLNEPWCAAMLGYAAGVHAPGATSPRAGIRAAHHLGLAHGLGIHALRASTAAPLGLVYNIHQFYPASDSDDDLRAVAVADATGNWLYAEPVLKGRYDELTWEALGRHTDWEFVAGGDLETMSAPIEFVGLNYYSPSTLRRGRVPQAAPTPWVGAEDVEWLPARPPVTEMGWTIEPQGLTDLLQRFHERYPGVELIVSENGAAMPDRPGDDGVVHDQDRIDYLASHIGAVAAARAAGVPVTGYFAWSLMDNFEWSFGYSKRFGLIRVDYDTCERTWKDSARWFQQFLATRTLA